MTAALQRKELHTMIDAMPDNFISAMMPLVSCITEEYLKPVIEPASAEECELIEQRIRESSPQDWVPLSGI